MKNIIHFETLGCRLNQDETEGAARSFSDAGFACEFNSVSSGTNPSQDVILSVINTCTVTGKAEQKARRIIRLLLEKFFDAPLIVTGCYAELADCEITSISENRIIIVPGTKKFILKEISVAMNGGTLDFKSGKFNFENLKSFVNKKLFHLKKLTLQKKFQRR